MKKIVTKQGILNHVYRFIVRQGEQSFGNVHGLTRACKYRVTKKNGKILACAAGCLVTDEEAKKLTEDVVWTAQYEAIPERFKRFQAFISELQSCHDTAPAGKSFVKQFKINVKCLAQKEGLTVPTDV